MIVGHIGAGSSSPDTGDIQKSLRFRGAQYLSRTFGTPTDNNVWTYSAWLKRGDVAAVSTPLLSVYIDANNYTQLSIDANQQLTFSIVNAGVARANSVSNQVFREPSSHMHIVLVADRAQGTDSNRIKMYVNGTQITAWVTTPTWTNTFASHINGNGQAHRIGNRNVSYLDGYLSRICFVDGSALTPSSFGYLNTEINEWVSKSQSTIKAVVDAGGTNSFMLDFDNGSSLTTLGYDKSSKGNNWTLNNHSLTAGVTYDWMEDRPGNSYAVWNPISKYWVETLSAGNLTSSGTPCGGYGTIAANSGKWYFEVVHTTIGSALPTIGVRSANLSNDYYITYISDGRKNVNGSLTAYGATWTTNDVIGVALDFDSGQVTFYKNNVSQGALVATFAGRDMVPFVGTSSTAGADVMHGMFGQAPLHASATYQSAAGGFFRYTPPTGFKALCQQNIPTPAVLNPKKHFDAKTYTGTDGVGGTVTGMSCKPEFLWVKTRATGNSHRLADIVRGTQAALSSDSTSAEATGSTLVTAFNDDGFTYGTASGYSGGTAIAWGWKAGGTAVTNTAGSITSQVSANTEMGFSIVTYTGTGANATVGHGLGKAPGLVIVRNRQTVTDWKVWHSGLTSASYAVELNTTGAQASSATYWNSTAPTSTVFSLGSAVATNENAKNFVALFFTDSSMIKCGSYVGNGNADGPFVFTGHKTRLLLVKRIDVAGYGWEMIDSARSPDNPTDDWVYANSANAESSGAAQLIDFTANGFKPRTTDAYSNANGGTYIYLSIAETAGKFSNAR